MNRFAPLLVFLAGCASAAPRPAADPAEAEVLEAARGMYADLSARKWDALAEHFLPDAVLTFSGKDGPRRQTPAKFIEFVSKKLEGKTIFDERMKEGSARVHGNVAHVWSRFEGREGTESEIRTWSGVDAFTLVKVGGRWKIALIAVSQDPPHPTRLPYGVK